MREVEALRRCPYTGTARKSRRRTQPFSHFVPLHKLGNLLHWIALNFRRGCDRTLWPILGRGAVPCPTDR